jgi:hypothetical protein
MRMNARNVDVSNTGSARGSVAELQSCIMAVNVIV